MLFKTFIVCFSITFRNWNWYFLIFNQRPWGNWLFTLTFFCQQFWIENECDLRSGKCLFDMNICFFYWFIWSKDFKWSIKSNQNIFKRKKFNFFHSQTDRKTFVDIFIFQREKKGYKSASITSFATLTEEDIDIIRQRGFNTL